MSSSIRMAAVAALLAAASAFAITPVAAAPIGHPMTIAGTGLTQQVHWHGRGWGWGGGAFVGGLAAGALIGGALAAPYGYPYYYGPAYYGPAYAPAPAYAPPPGDAVSYCMQRYRSYDPRSGTFLGNDGRRHPCP